MKFICPDHGKQKKVQHAGYSLGHSRFVQMHERDLEGIPFTFEVQNLDDSPEVGLELELVDADGARSYLSKFAEWEEQVTEAAENEMEHSCPECGNGSLLYWLEDDEDW